MRKLISLIALILCLTFSIGIAASAEFDLSSMTTEELQALTRLIAEEIAKRSASVVEKEKEETTTPTDTKQYSAMDLINICAAIKEEIAKRNAFDSFDVPVGMWTVGKHLNPGEYSISPKAGEEGAFITLTSERFGGGSQYLFIFEKPEHFSRITLTQGDTLQIDWASITLSPATPYPSYEGENALLSPVDVSGYSDDELQNAYANAFMSLWNQSLPKITVEGGFWTIGIDIPEGTYDIELYTPNSIGDLYIYEDYYDFSRRLSPIMYLSAGGNTDRLTSRNVNLKAGTVIFVNSGQASFTTADENIFFGH